MTTWTTISNAAVAVGGIPSSSTVTALRDNPAAMAETATGAPVVFAGWHPVDKVSVGDGKTGLIYDHAVNGTVAEIETPDFEDGYEYRLIASQLSHDGSGSSRTLSISANRQTSGYIVVYTTGATFLGGSTLQVVADMVLPRLQRPTQIWKVLVATAGGFDPEVNAAFSASSEKILNAKLTWSGGSFDAGKVWLFRRREYASSP